MICKSAGLYLRQTIKNFEMEITPAKPRVLACGHITISLKKSEVDVSDIEKTAKKMGFIEQTSRHISIIAGKTEDEIYKILNELEPDKRKKLFSQIKKMSVNLTGVLWPKKSLITSKNAAHLAARAN